MNEDWMEKQRLVDFWMISSLLNIVKTALGNKDADVLDIGRNIIS